MKIRKNDTVLVIAGKDKGKKGNVHFVYPKDNRVLVDGVNMVKRHVKARQDVKQAGIIEREATLDLSDVMLICNKCSKPARVGYRILEDGKKVRFCRNCQEVID